MRSLLLLALSLCLSPTARATPKHQLIMPLGDSITAGGYNDQQGWHIGGGYRTTLAEVLWAHTVEFHLVGSQTDGPETFPEPHHEGHSGWEIAQLTAGVPTWLPRFQPDVILLMIGTNDFIHDHDIAHAPDRLELLLTAIRSLSPDSELLVSTVILTNNQKWNHEIQSYNRAIKTIVERRSRSDKHLSFVDLAGQAGLGTTDQDLIDGVHPTVLGYAKLGKAWATAALKVLSPPVR